MNTEITNLLIFIFICFIIYLLFRHLNKKEGMVDISGNNYSSSNSASNGIANNSSTYSASVKNTTIQLQDLLLISKYKTNYETVIVDLDDLINNMMLKTTLSIDTNNPDSDLLKLSQLGQAKIALNSVMKYLDSQ